jgi:recombination protein RecT
MAEVQAFPIQLRQFVESKQTDLASTLPKQIDPERFLRVALLAVTKNKALWECSKESVFLAIMESARVGLQIDNKEAALIPYGGHAEFMPMVQGIIRLMLRSPGLTKVEARVVRDGDQFEYRYGLDPQLEHKPIGGSDRPITHAYAVMWRQGAGTTFEVVTREEIEQVRSSSRAPDSPAWKNWYGEMCRKVVLKRLAKYADLSPEATRAIELDHVISGSEPWGSEYVEGPSEEFRNQLVKNQTEAGIARLKDKMAGAGISEGNGSEQEQPEEALPQPAEETPESGHEKPSPATRQDWPTLFWELANRYELDKEQINEVLVKHDNNFHHAYEALKASLEPEPPQ